MKNSPDPKVSLAFALSSWELISWLWNVLPDGSVFVCLGAWSTGQSYDVIYDGTLGYMVSVLLLEEIRDERHQPDLQGLETRVQSHGLYVKEPQ